MRSTVRDVLPQSLFRPVLRECSRRFSLPGVDVLADDVRELHGTVLRLERPHRRAWLNRLKLAGVANKDNLRPDVSRLCEGSFELRGTHHPGFIDDENVLPSEPVAPVVPCPLPRRECSRRNSGRLRIGEAFGRFAGEGSPDDRVSLPFPSGARRCEHGALASAGVALHKSEVSTGREIPDRRGLFVRQLPGTRSNGRVDSPLTDRVPATERERLRIRKERALRGQYRLRRETPYAFVGGHLDELGRGEDGDARTFELFFVDRVAVDRSKQLPLRENGLLGSQQLEHDLGSRKNALAVAPGQCIGLALTIEHELAPVEMSLCCRSIALDLWLEFDASVHIRTHVDAFVVTVVGERAIGGQLPGCTPCALEISLVPVAPL